MDVSSFMVHRPCRHDVRLCLWSCCPCLLSLGVQVSSLQLAPFEEKYFGECEASNQQTVLHHPVKDDAQDEETPRDSTGEIERFHLLCYGGFTVQARRFVAKNPWSLWATSYSIIAETCLRATDYCRLGKNHGFETKDLLQHLERLEDVYLSSLSLNSVFS